MILFKVVFFPLLPINLIVLIAPATIYSLSGAAEAQNSNNEINNLCPIYRSHRS